METRLLRTSALLVLIVISGALVNGQFNHVGVKTGLNLSNAVIANTEYTKLYGDEKFNVLPGFTMGLMSQASGNGYMATSIGLFYSGSGFKGEDNVKLSIHNIVVPLEFRGRIPIVEPVVLQLGMGPYVSFGFAGAYTDKDSMDLKYTDRDVLSLRSKNDGATLTSGDLKQYNRLDAGIIFGGEVEVTLPNNAFVLVGFSYSFGIMSISNEWDFNEIFAINSQESNWVNPGFKNRVMSITVSYMFDVTDIKKNKKQ